MAKTIKDLEQELAEALAAKEAAEQKAKQAETEKAKALEEKEAAEKEAADSKVKTEELLKATEEAERKAQSEVNAFFKDSGKAKMVNAIFPTLRGKDADPDIIINVNGKTYQIRRGVNVKVPDYVLEAYNCSELAKNEEETFIRENAN